MVQLTTVLAGSFFFATTFGLPSMPLTQRDSPDNRCGPQFGGNNCNSVAGQYKCCSQYNYCGDTADHCGTGCQSTYGTCTGGGGGGGGTTTTPAGPGPTTTPPSTGGRSKPGSVPYGVQLASCTVPGTIALTYDDGPWTFTNQLLDLLSTNGVKVTFFVTGNNLDKGSIDEVQQWRDVVARAYNDGHQIASHTWDHFDLDSLSESDRRFQMTRLETALVSIIGRYPTYMRPPFIRCQGPCLATMNDLGYHVMIWDLNTDDYNNASPTLIENSKNNVRVAVDGTNPANRNFMSIAHDIHEQTVVSLTQYQIDIGKKNGYRHVRIGECFGDPESNWYRT